ncbi:hypothetical protein [Halorussus ruber]|uniref:hypothetical protein n=1 Tax=Halorussus ruber TaxID=1126238 RepID=UPI0010922C95|nr:hypothetical protein [Halorussus ruber]
MLGRPTASERLADQPPANAWPTNRQRTLGRTPLGWDEGAARSRPKAVVVSASNYPRRAVLRGADISRSDRRETNRVSRGHVRFAHVTATGRGLQ